MAKGGATVTDLKLSADFDSIDQTHQRVSSFEFSRNRAWELDNHFNEISQTLRENRLRHGAECRFEDYREARQHCEDLRLLLDEVFKDVDVILTPSAPGVAPVGLNATGSHSFSSIWTACHTPSMTLPLFKGIMHCLSASNWLPDAMLTTIYLPCRVGPAVYLTARV